MINTVGGQYIQIGTILPFGGANIPNGYLLCDGRSLSVTDFQDLFNVIGYAYGGEGNSFNIPDLRNRFPQGADSNLGDSIEAGLPNITGEISFRRALTEPFDYIDGALKHEYITSSYNQNSGNSTPARGSRISIDASLSNDIYGKSETVQPPAQTVNYIIKATKVDAEPSIGDITLDDTKATQTNVFSAYKVNNELLNLLSVINNIFQYETNEYGNYLKFNGIIIQWGTFSKGSNLAKNAGWDFNVTLPTSFSDTNFVFMVTSGTDSTTGTASGEEIATRNDDVNKVFVSWWNRNSSTTAMLPKLNWFAIGK